MIIWTLTNKTYLSVKCLLNYENTGKKPMNLTSPLSPSPKK